MTSSFCTVLDLPDEILVNIILFFNPKERLTLAKTCQKFHDLVFGDKKLLRDLNFSKAWYITSAKDVRQYFVDKNACERILKLNLENVRFPMPGMTQNDVNKYLLSDYGMIPGDLICKAVNLVDLNIRGSLFTIAEEFVGLLKSLIHLRRLALTWPRIEWKSLLACISDTGNLLCRLTRLEVELKSRPDRFLPFLKFCHDLDELRLITRSGFHSDLPMSPNADILRYLRIIQFCIPNGSTSLKERLMSLVPEPREWTDFHLVKAGYEGYLERDVPVCRELLRVKLRPTPENTINLIDPCSVEIGWNLISELLLREVIALNYLDVPHKLCCFDEFRDSGFQSCVLRIDEAKRLLEDPGYQLSYLFFKHSIDPDCDVHLVASAFPNLKELVFARISKRDGPLLASRITTHVQGRLRRRDDATSMGTDHPENGDSSFKILVENTPNLRGVTFFSLDADGNELWDLEALHLIPRWKNLRAIRMKDVPITDGEFLINIGKECTELEEILLIRLGPSDCWCYAYGLFYMLSHCKNLRKFSICQNHIRNVSVILDKLSQNSGLTHVRLITRTEFFYDDEELEWSVEQMLHRCLKLTKFVFMVKSDSDLVAKELERGLKRVVDGLNRLNFEFHGPVPTGSSSAYEDPSESIFVSPLDDRHFAYDDS